MQVKTYMVFDKADRERLRVEYNPPEATRQVASLNLRVHRYFGPILMQDEETLR